MVQDRKEPTLNGIAPDRDEILTHQNRMGTGGGAKRPPGQRQAAQRPIVKSSPLGGFALVIALVATGAAGYAGWQLFETQKTLDSASQRIAGLEQRLNLTDSQSTDTVKSIDEKLDWADSEIRKLWGVSYDTNRKAIAANKDNITAVSGRLNDASEAVDGVKAQMNEQQLLVNRAVEDVNIQEQQLKQINDLAKQVEAVAKQLESRVADSEEAIEAINAFRSSANADIQRLKQQMSQGQGPG